MNTCTQCAAQFSVAHEDRKFLEMFSPTFGGKKYQFPDPDLCPTCRQQNRLATRNERTLYRRICDKTGKKIISCFSQDNASVVYENDVWWSNSWSPLDYGRDFDFNRSFFEQFRELRNQVPRMARQQQEPIENCDYSNGIGHSRNCYLMSSTNNCEDCCYGMWVNNSKNCIDNYVIQDCELCYECVNCRNCYDLKYSEDCVNCRDSAFLVDAIGCQECFGSVNLRNKKYVLFNEQLTKEEYRTTLQQPEFDLRCFASIEPLLKKMGMRREGRIVKEFHGVNLENCSGDYLRNCKNTYQSFDCDDTEDIRYCVGLQSSRNSMDHTHWGAKSELIYNCQACGYDVYNLRCTFLGWGGCSDLLYCDHCFNSRHCFGCAGLKNGRYCVLNKEYSKEEYEKLVPGIIEHMENTLLSPHFQGGSKGRSEWGQFFPVAMSPFAYNETIAQEYFPLSREEILQKGWKWKEPEEPDFSEVTKKIPATKLPDSIDDIPDDILNWAIIDKSKDVAMQRLYKIQKTELEFYRKTGLTIPRFHPEIRHRRRFVLRNPRQLWQRNCMNCKKEIQTTYEPGGPEKVYCEHCYLAEVY